MHCLQQSVCNNKWQVKSFSHSIIIFVQDDGCYYKPCFLYRSITSCTSPAEPRTMGVRWWMSVGMMSGKKKKIGWEQGTSHARHSSYSPYYGCNLVKVIPVGPTASSKKRKSILCLLCVPDSIHMICEAQLQWLSDPRITLLTIWWIVLAGCLYTS